MTNTTNTLYVSTEPDPMGSETIQQDSVYGGTYPVRVSHYVRERGAGAPIPTAGGQRDSLKIAGPFATIGEAESAMSNIIAQRATS